MLNASILITCMRKLVCIVLLGITAHQASAQNDIITIPLPANSNLPHHTTDSASLRRLQANLNRPINTGNTGISLVVPVYLSDGQFKQTSNNLWGGGIGLSFMHNPLHKMFNPAYVRPYVIGAYGEYCWFSSSASYKDVTINGYTYEQTSKVNTGAFTLGYQSRMEFGSRDVYLFGIGQAGIRLFDGNQNVKYASDDVNAPVLQNTSVSLESSWTTYYGYGGGIGIGGRTVRLEIQVVKQFGSKANYINPASVTVDHNNRVSYTTLSSKTNLIIPQLNLGIVF